MAYGCFGADLAELQSLKMRALQIVRNSSDSVLSLQLMRNKAASLFGFGDLRPVIKATPMEEGGVQRVCPSNPDQEKLKRENSMRKEKSGSGLHIITDWKEPDKVEESEQLESEDCMDPINFAELSVDRKSTGIVTKRVKQRVNTDDRGKVVVTAANTSSMADVMHGYCPQSTFRVLNRGAVYDEPAIAGLAVEDDVFQGLQGYTTKKVKMKECITQRIKMMFDRITLWITAMHVQFQLMNVDSEPIVDSLMCVIVGHSSLEYKQPRLCDEKGLLLYAFKYFEVEDNKNVRCV